MNMNKKQSLIIVFLVILICVTCSTKNPNNSIVIIKEKDSIEIKQYQHIIDSLEHSLNDAAEILHQTMIINDSLKYKLFVNADTIKYYKEKYLVNEYKLLRIKQYNSIAAKGNNIKYLRGWINRVLND